MATSSGEFQLAAAAAGFTLGFGFLTVWEAIKQTRANRSPLRSPYIYMIWGEIVANLAIGIMGWLMLHGILKLSVITLFFGLFFWVFEIQLLMQIIINRITIIADDKVFVRRLKWGTAAIITMINIAVFCIWIPAHTMPPASATYVLINKYWDRTSKCLICLVDAGLNWYFLHTVRVRLVNYYGLVKYAPLVSFNAKLMVVSVTLDIMIIALMSLPNQLVYIQFQAACYTAKLNIEMCMASLITRLARGQADNDMHYGSDNYTHQRSRRPTIDTERRQVKASQTELQSHDVPVFYENSTESSGDDSILVAVPKDPTRTSITSGMNIVCQTDLHVAVQDKNVDNCFELHESGHCIAMNAQKGIGKDGQSLTLIPPVAHQVGRQASRSRV